MLYLVRESVVLESTGSLVEIQSPDSDGIYQFNGYIQTSPIYITLNVSHPGLTCVVVKVNGCTPESVIFLPQPWKQVLPGYLAVEFKNTLPRLLCS